MAWPRICTSSWRIDSGWPAAIRSVRDDVDAGDHLGHRMLDLHAGVHLDEVELAVLVEKLEGAGAAVADLTAGLHAALGHFGRA
jgi:hypothetical protein